MGIDILVPVLGRPHNAQPLADSAERTWSDYRLVFICSPKDREQIAACRATGHEVIVAGWHPGHADFAKKINVAFAYTDSEWVFQGADDIRFGVAWDVPALRLAASKRKRVIGTNDLHNPQVRRGQGSTHTLFARSYIEERGGTDDGSGTVFCELYDHQFVDSEFIELAKRRREWIYCQASVVEHFHPHWGNAETDDTYKKATRSTGADAALFRERMGMTTRAERNKRRMDSREAVRLQRRRG